MSNVAITLIADSFNEVFGIEVVEPTRNGVWFESRRYGNGKLRKNPKLMFITKSALAYLLDEIEEKNGNNDERI